MPAQTRAMAQASNTVAQQPPEALQTNAVPSAKSVSRRTAEAGVSANPRLPGKHQDDTVLLIKKEPADDHQLHIDPIPTSPLLHIAAEIRLAIFKWCLPCDERLILDPHFLSTPHCAFQQPLYMAVWPLLLVSKQINMEIITLVYSRITLTACRAIDIPLLHKSLPKIGLQQIKKVEVQCVSKNLGELGRLFFEWRDFLPAAKHLKLNFYHCSEALACLGELAWRMWRTQALTLKLELHESSWARQHGEIITHSTINNALNIGSYHFEVFDIKLPTQIKTVTISISTVREAAYIFATYRHAENGKESHLKWRFNKNGDKDTPGCKNLVWEKPA